MQKETITIDRYQRQRRLGEGPMSDVWLARDTDTQNLVAIKIMTAIQEDDLRNSKASERFSREIEIARSLHHPNILPVLDWGDMNYKGRIVPFLVSPFMSDGSLVEVLDESPPWDCWSLQQIADAIVQAADSLYYLHTREPVIVHQDVKPANFLVKAIDTPERMYHLYLSDFGISRWKKSSHTMASEVLGTFAFMAPEQAERKIIPASDQYALAIVATLLLTGKLPIQARTNEEYIYAHMNEQPLMPSELFPERFPSSAVDDVLLQALDKSSSRRFPSIVDFALALQQALLDLEQDLAEAVTEPLLPYDVVEPNEQEEQAEQEERAEPVVPDTPVFPIDSFPIEPYSNASHENFPIVLNFTEPTEHHVLDEPLPEKPQPVEAELRMSEPVEFRTLEVSQVANIELPSRPKALEWSWNGDMLACVLYSHVPVYLARGGTLSTVQLSQAQKTSTLCWSPDGRVLALAIQGEIRFWDTQENMELPLVIPMNVRTIDNMHWSKNWQLAVWIDASIILYTLPSHTLLLRQAPVPQRLATNGVRNAGTGVLRWSTNGSYLAIGGSNGAILCWDRDHENALWEVAKSGQRVNSLTWSPDGIMLACAFRDNKVRAWDVQQGECVLQWQNLPAMCRTFSISMDAQLLIATSEHRLLLGTIHDTSPNISVPGQLLVAWSPTRREFATLDEQRENILALCQQ